MKQITVIVERSFEEPTTVDAFHAAATSAAWCSRPVKLLRSYLSLDARSSVCVYHATDADEARSVLRDSQVVLGRVWIAQVVGFSTRFQAPTGQSTIVVERDLPQPMSPDDVEPALRTQKPCFDANRIEHLQSNLSLDGLRSICLYAAPDAESVRRAHRELGSPAVRAWTAIVRCM